jgi:hypothetical protein
MWDNLRTLHNAESDYRADEPRLITPDNSKCVSPVVLMRCLCVLPPVNATLN